MKTIPSLLRSLRRPALLAALALGALASAAQAVEFDRWVFANGRWALILPGSNTGGRVQWSSTHGCYITDRAARGETVGIYSWATAAGEYSLGSYRTYTCGRTGMGAVALPSWQEFVVSTSPHCDTLTYTHCTNYRVNGLTKGIPIGSRP
jgi:hypothetical protein